MWNKNHYYTEKRQSKCSRWSQKQDNLRDILSSEKHREETSVRGKLIMRCETNCIFKYARVKRSLKKEENVDIWITMIVNIS
jgi:hypothetical protein